MNLIALPRDVHFVIWSNLDLPDILRLRQTCSKLSTAISDDKQLWAYILKRDVQARSLCVPSNFRELEDVDAQDIESCVKHTIMLNQTYKEADKGLFVRKIGTRSDLRVTWLKVVLGRWCLIAAANYDESELSMWEILSDGDVRCVAKAYLEAPVIDGEIDVSSGEIRCAITVGTMQPYILVFGIYQSTTNVVFRQFAKIPSASHVRFLQGDIVGFAVQNGDDTYPYLADWTTANMSCLRFPHAVSPDNPSPLPIEPCITMAILDNYIFTLHRTAIHVFISSEALNGALKTPLKHVAILPFREAIVVGGKCLDISSTEHGAILYFFIQDLHSGLLRARVEMNGSFGKDEQFSMTVAFINNPPNVMTGRRVIHQYHLGTHGRKMFCATSLRLRAWWNPVFLLVSLHGASDEDPFETEGDYLPISRDNLPFSHLLSCVDFDDGYGLLLMGTVSGDVRLASFLPNNILASGSVKSNLSLSIVTDVITKPPNMSQVPRNLDLPVLYRIRKAYNFYDDLPPHLARQAVRQWQVKWQDQNNGLHPFSQWSNVWLKFERVWDWVVPFSRWGIIDADFNTITSSAAIRWRLQALGEIIPVLYDIHNHCRVVFRIGERMFYYRSKREEEDEEGEIEFEVHDGNILGVLPLTYDQFLSNPVSMLPALSSFPIQRNLERWTIPSGQCFQKSLADHVYTVREHCKNYLKIPYDDEAISAWSNMDWEKYRHSAAGIRYVPYEEPLEKPSFRRSNI